MGKTKIVLLLSQQDFFVAEADKISNLRLVEDIYKILEFFETNCI